MNIIKNIKFNFKNLFKDKDFDTLMLDFLLILMTLGFILFVVSIIIVSEEQSNKTLSDEDAFIIYQVIQQSNQLIIPR